MGYLMPRPSFQQNSRETFQSIAGWDKVIHTFPGGTTRIVDVTVPLEFEHAYHDVIVQRVSAFHCNQINEYVSFYFSM